MCSPLACAQSRAVFRTSDSDLYFILCLLVALLSHPLLVCVAVDCVVGVRFSFHVMNPFYQFIINVINKSKQSLLDNSTVDVA